MTRLLAHRPLWPHAFALRWSHVQVECTTCCHGGAWWPSREIVKHDVIHTWRGKNRPRMTVACVLCLWASVAIILLTVWLLVMTLRCFQLSSPHWQASMQRLGVVHPQQPAQWRRLATHVHDACSTLPPEAMILSFWVMILLPKRSRYLCCSWWMLGANGRIYHCLLRPSISYRRPAASPVMVSFDDWPYEQESKCCHIYSLHPYASTRFLGAI